MLIYLTTDNINSSPILEYLYVYNVDEGSVLGSVGAGDILY